MIKKGFNNLRPCVIGLGYVGLPVFLNLQYHIKTVGYDVNKERVQYLKRRIDTNNEFKKNELVLKKKISFFFKFQ